MQRKRWWWALVLCCGWQVPLSLAAARDDFLDMSLEELVDYRLMSMSRKEQRVADMAAAAHVVTAEDIRRSGAQSVPEALRLVPGLNVAQIASNRWAVSARGFNDRLAGKLLVLLDGRNIYSPFVSGVLWENQDVLMEDIERIEVIRGPGAALWGTNAMNGVINIITRTAASSQGSLVSTTVGTDGTAKAAARHGGALSGGGHYKVYAKQTHLDGSIEHIGSQSGNDRVNQQRVGIRLDPDVRGGQLSIQAELHQGRSGDVWTLPAVRAYSDPGTPYVRQSTFTSHDYGGALQGRYAWIGDQGAENVFQAFIDHESTNYDSLWGSGTVPNGVLGQAPSFQTVGANKSDVDVEFQQRRVWGLHDFIWGLNLRHTNEQVLMPGGPYYLAQSRDRRVNYSAFVHDEISLSPDRFKLIVGSKFEHDGLTGFNMQPNIRTLFTPNGSEAFWTALSRSARSPRRSQSMSTIDAIATDAATLTGQPLPPNLTAIVQTAALPNAAVKAEKALTLEGGWRRQFSNFLSVDTALFVTDYSQLSGVRSMPLPAADVLRSVTCFMTPGTATANGSRCYLIVPGYNSSDDRARSWGGEFALEWHARPWWKVQGAYSYVRVKGVTSGDAIGDRNLLGIENSTPRHHYFLTNHFQLDAQWSLNARLRHVSQSTHSPLSVNEAVVVPAYTTLDLRLAWQVNRQTELSLMGRNLLQDRHLEFVSSLPTTQIYDVRRSLLAQAVIRF